jgi:UDP-N-acetylglucosamine 2-epimerase (non-hydrolysing)
MTSLMKIISVAGARPNFIKIAPLNKEFSKYSHRVNHKICHTGQHFDEKMSKVFFDDLNLPKPDFYLGVGSSSHAVQTAQIMIEFEKILLDEKPDLVCVVGDVNSTMACSIVASKLNIKIAHVEAGLRSFDRCMPEEINRMVTDTLSDFLFVSETSGLDNLKREGVPNSKVFFTGNIMIDSLMHYLDRIDQSNILMEYQMEKHNYILATFHRPSNVDSGSDIQSLVKLLNHLSEKRKIIFPVHPRTMKKLQENKLVGKMNSNIIATDPMGYIDFLCLVKNAELVITDSGGIQEETTYMGIQCLTVRKNTERPVTVNIGTNQLVGTDISAIKNTADKVLDGKVKKGGIPKLWDGKTAERIVSILIEKLS